MLSQITIFKAVVYGPMSVGFVVLFLTILFARRWGALIAAFLISMLLSFGTFVILRILVGYGEAWSGYGPEHDFPNRVLAIGFFVNAALVAVRILWRSGLHCHASLGGRLPPRPPSQT